MHKQAGVEEEGLQRLGLSHARSTTHLHSQAAKQELRWTHE